MKDNIIKFTRERDYQFVRDLGQGACGKTVLLHDDQIDQDFVCKKFAPLDDNNRDELFSSFVTEVKLLYQLFHQNVVRVFNCYIYPKESTGYILMEYIDGTDIEDFVARSPEIINDLFLQAVSGFRHLEANNILHRDIRPRNLMVSNNGTLKIIDLGFGKRVELSEDFDKSISLNLWCERPREFAESKYDFTTEVYFVGKLFERIIESNEIGHFKFSEMLNRMCQYDPRARIRSFDDVEKEIQGNRLYEIGFVKEQLETYRIFANAVSKHVTKILNDTKYESDVDEVTKELENKYWRFRLEEFVPNCGIVLSCFLDGGFYYKPPGFPVEAVRGFIRLLKSSTREQGRIILLNLQNRLDAIPRYDEPAQGADMPF